LNKKMKTPESILNHKYAAVFAKEWKMIHMGMQGNSFNFFIGTNGTGKSYAALKRAEIIGVNEHDEYGFSFDPDHLENHVFFDKKQMMSKIAELEKLNNLEKTRGYQLILDEAQMSANAKDWNNKEVLNFSKDMTTIRSSRLSICLTMPTHRMITTDLRQLGIYQVQMAPAETMNLEKGISHSKLHYLKLEPHLGEIWRNRPLIVQHSTNPISQLNISRKGKLNDFIWKLPSAKTKHRYEELKKAFKDQRADEHEATIEATSTRKSLFKEMVNGLREKWDTLTDLKPAQLVWRVIKDFDCSEAQARKVIAFVKVDMEGL
jgi:hypothetical protein